MDAWQSIILAIGGNAAILAVLGFLAKSLVNNFVTRDLKRFEMELKSKSDIEINRLKNELEIAKFEHQVRFSKLHEKRAEVIAEVYKRLVTALWETESFLSPMQWAGEPSQNEKYVSAINNIVESFRFFDQHRIYLPEPLCELLEAFIKDLRSPTIQLGTYIGIENPNPNTLDEKHKIWVKAWQSVEKEFPVTRKKLEVEFRKIIEGAT